MTDERRSKVRYPLELSVRYETLEGDVEASGVGRTLNVSSNGLLIATQGKIKEGSLLKVTIEWPSMLHGTTPLQLVTVGRVVRRLGSYTAVALEKYQFKTKRRAATKPIALSAGMIATQPGTARKSNETTAAPERPMEPVEAFALKNAS